VNWLFGLTFVVAFTYTVADLLRRADAALDRRAASKRAHVRPFRPGER
jgi:hypothetical protein